MRGIGPNQPLQLLLHGPTSTELNLQISSDLLTWTTLATFTNVASMAPYSDPTAVGLAFRFYRGVTNTGPAAIHTDIFGTNSGKPVYIFTLTNTSGMQARICTYGGILTSLLVPDRNGKLGDVVLGYDNLAGYVTNSPYFGALIGRYANRIANGRFILDGKTYTLAINNAPNSLHGGNKGFDKVLWTGRPTGTAEEPGLEMTYLSKDMEEGYPGNLSVRALYTLTRDNALRLDFTAATDKDTIVNLTDHTYFNLAGSGDVLAHEVMIDADNITPVDSTLIPTGKFQPVAGTAFDFTQPHTIGERISTKDTQLAYGGGYDHNWVLNKSFGTLGLIARVHEPISGRVLEVFSTEPGLQFYSGNSLNGSIVGKNGVRYIRRGGFTMEPQHFPDSPNKKQFPSTVLSPGQIYRNTIIYRFSVQ
jgi:aldose 1-epimerase